MRVIGGTARGRRLRAPRTAAVRPTADRVREAIFDVLGALDAVEGAAVCDLFAGSGALGIEALSRGAASVVFVESDRLALETLRGNLETTGFATEPGVRVVRGDALAYLAARPAPVDLLFADPPYAFDEWDRLLGLVRAGLVVAEHRRPLELPEQLVVHRTYHYGTTIVTVARAREGTSASSASSASGDERRGAPGGEPEDDA